MPRKTTAKREARKSGHIAPTDAWQERNKRPLLKKRPSAGWPKARNEQHKDTN